LLIIAGSLLLLFVAVRTLVRIPSVQTWVVQKAAGYLSDELKTDVRIGSIDIKFFKSIALTDVFIADQRKDTLLFAPELTVSLSRISISKHQLFIQEANINNARIGIVHYKNPREYNLDFIIRYFSPSDSDTTPSKHPWAVKIENVKLLNNTLTYRDEKYPITKHRRIDWDDVKLTKLNLHITDLVPVADTIDFTIEKLSCVEKSGFVLNAFSGDLHVIPGSMTVNKMKILSPYSDVAANAKFDYDHFSDFEDFIEKVRWKGDFTESKLSFTDLQYFAEELFHIDRTIVFSGSARGTVDRFKVKDLSLRYSDDLYFKGNASMTGLPNFDETYMELDVADLCLKKEQIETLPAYPFDSIQLVKLPDNLSSLGEVHFKGKFNGFYNDFVAYGNTTTELGFLSSDINLKIDPVDRKTSYSGKLTLFDFDMGKLWNLNPDLGKVSLKTKVDGHGFELNNIEANLEGEVSQIQLYKYNYSNIRLNGHLAKKLFTGELAISDPNLDMDFEGEVDLRPELPIYNFNSSIRKARLAKLNLLKRDPSAEFSAEVAINMMGNNIDNAEGTIQLEDVVYRENDKEVRSDRVFLESKIEGRRELNFESDFADAQVVGKYTLTDLPAATRQIISKYIPATFKAPKVVPKDQDITFRAEVKRTQQLFDIFYPTLSIAKGTTVEGAINSNTDNFSLLFKSDQIGIETANFSNISIAGTTGANGLDLRTSIQEISFADELTIDNLKLNGITRHDTASITMSLEGADSLKSQARVRFDTQFLQTGYTTIKLVPEILRLDGQDWTIDDHNYILIDSSGVLLNDINLASGVQHLNLEGIASKDTTGRMLVEFKDFESGNLNDLLKLYDINIGGKTNGTARISSLLKRPAITADLQIETLRWYNDTLGDAVLTSNFNGKDGVVDVNAIVTRGGDKNISVIGQYLIKEKDDELNFKIDLQKTYLQSFSHYLEGLASNISGIASANLMLTGTAKKPLLTGKAILQKANFMVDYLKTSYSFSTEVELTPKFISFNKVTLNDVKGNKSTVSGKIFHDNLTNWYFDIDINAKNAQVLNTTLADNDLYYGVAYASGTLSIKGYLDYITMNIGLKSEKGTRIYIPLNNPEEVSKSNFITFVSSDSIAKTEKDNGPDFSGIELNMDFEMTTDAYMYLVFDSKIGDVIEGNGKGNITMTISPAEDLKMFGNYEIESGKYLFTMQNVINKPFQIERGGFIRWNGDPYDANINISAIYKTKAGLYDLFQDSTFKKSVPVNLQLRLTDKLFNPNIAFDIKVQNVDPTVETQISKLINTEEEKYRQAMALIIARRFTTPSALSDRGTVSSGGVVGSNAYELLSNQLSNWASQISNQFNVNVSYNPGDEITTEQFEVGVQTSILNDRVVIDVSGGTSSAIKGQNTSNLVGDFNVEVKANKDGRIRLKAFNRSNNNSLINNINSPYTQGVGIFYRQEFNSFKELAHKFKESLKRKRKVSAPATGN